MDIRIDTCGDMRIDQVCSHACTDTCMDMRMDACMDLCMDLCMDGLGLDVTTGVH